MHTILVFTVMVFSPTAWAGTCASYEFFEDSRDLWELDLLQSLNPVDTGTITVADGNPVDLNASINTQNLDGYGYEFEFDLPSVDGDSFEIRIASDDGSRLFATDSTGEILLIDNGGIHALQSESVRFTVSQTAQGVLPLSIRIEYFDVIQVGELQVFISKNNEPERELTCADTLNTNNVCATYRFYQDPILLYTCLLYTSPSPRDRTRSRMPSSA